MTEPQTPAQPRLYATPDGRVLIVDDADRWHDAITLDAVQPPAPLDLKPLYAMEQRDELSDLSDLHLEAQRWEEARAAGLVRVGTADDGRAIYAAPDAAAEEGWDW